MVSATEKSGKLSSPEKLSASPELFSGGSDLTQVTSSIPIWEASNVLTQRQHLPWETDPDGKLIYSRDVNNGEGAICFRIADNTEEEHPSTLAGAAALAVINTFDIRAACMHLIYVAHASQMENPWEQELVLNDRQIETYLGLQRRTDKNRQEKLALIEKIVKQPCKITTFISWPGEGNRKKFTLEEGRLWHLLGTRYHYQENLLGEKQITGMSFVLKAGLWAKYFLSQPNSEKRDVPGREGVLSRALLESVMSLWQHRAGAARLMVWLLFKFQLSGVRTLPVRTLLEVAYGSHKVLEAQEDSQLRKKIVNAWDEDVLALHERDWRIQFDADTYPTEIRPLGFGRKNSRRPRGFFDSLLKAQLEIMPPESWDVSYLEATSTEVLEEDRSSNSHSLTGEECKAMRTAKGWSQRKLANLTGISQGLISMMENGARSISDDNDATLRHTFENF